MDNEADAAREYDRLRAELADFVLDALGERIAAGHEPALSRALTDAIDKRIDAAVQERLARSAMPDPEEFADAVIAAAAGRGGGDRLSEGMGRARSGRSETRTGTTDRARVPRLTILQIGLLAVIALAIVVALTIFLTRSFSAAPTVFEKNVQTNQFQQVPPADNGQVTGDNGTSAGAATNVQGGTP